MRRLTISIAIGAAFGYDTRAHALSRTLRRGARPHSAPFSLNRGKHQLVTLRARLGVCEPLRWCHQCNTSRALGWLAFQRVVLASRLPGTTRRHHAARREPLCPPREAPPRRPTLLDPAACNADQARGDAAPARNQHQHQQHSSGSGHQCQRQRQSHSRDHSNSIRHASQVIFIDCDDCLYQNDWETAAKITTSIAAYTANLGVSEEKAYALYKAHGTCLKGMLAEGFIASDAAEDFLLKVRANPNLNPTPTPTPTPTPKPEPEPEPEPRP